MKRPFLLPSFITPPGETYRPIALCLMYPPHFPTLIQVDAVVVGADRVVANGDTANKIGTYALSIIAAHHKVWGSRGQQGGEANLLGCTGREWQTEKRGARTASYDPLFRVSPLPPSPIRLCPLPSQPDPQFPSVPFSLAPLQVPFFVAAPSTTLDPTMPDGSHIVIEQRPSEEITHFKGQRTVKEGVQVWGMKGGCRCGV